MTDLFKTLRFFLIALVVYAGFVVAYFLLVLVKLDGWIKHVFDSNIHLYAILALALIVIQGIVLERFTTVLLRVVERAHGIAQVFRRLARPHELVLTPEDVPGLLVYRFAGPLFFFNADHFANRVQKLIDSANPPVTAFLIDAEATVDMDAYAIETLSDLHDSLGRQGVALGICGAKGHFLEVLQHARSEEGLKLMVYQSVDVAIKQIAKKAQ
jgi:MFS superfamily sulfate permease-like transporter